MELPRRFDLVVVGAGIAGLSTAIWARRLGLSTIVMEQAHAVGGQLQLLHHPIVDYPGVLSTSGLDLAAQLRQQATAAGAQVAEDQRVTRLHSATRTCETARGVVQGKAVVLATGLSPRELGIPGEANLHAAGRMRRPSKEPDHFRGKRVAVVGGGDRAAENALLLEGVASQVFLVHRGERLRARPEFVKRLDAAAQTTILVNRAVKRIATHGAVLELTLEQLGADHQLAVDELCVYIGNRPNTALAVDQLTLDDDGYVVIDRMGASSVAGVFAVGDVCTPPTYQSLIGAAGQAMVVAKKIALFLQENTGG